MSIYEYGMKLVGDPYSGWGKYEEPAMTLQSYEDWLNSLCERHDINRTKVDLVIDALIHIRESIAISIGSIDVSARQKFIDDLHNGLYRVWVEDNIKGFADKFKVIDKMCEAYNDPHAIELDNIQYFAGNGVTEIELED